MRKLLLLGGLFVLLAIACGGGNDIPELIPTIDPNAPEQTRMAGSEPGGDVQTPRDAAAESNDTGLPPTFTPAPSPVPATAQPPAPAGGGDSGSTGERYTVQAGDTLGEIATAYGVTVEELAAANGIVNIDVIEVGQVLIIP